MSGFIIEAACGGERSVRVSVRVCAWRDDTPLVEVCFLAVSGLRASIKMGPCPIWPRQLFRSLLVEKQEKEILTER